MVCQNLSPSWLPQALPTSGPHTRARRQPCALRVGMGRPDPCRPLAALPPWRWKGAETPACERSTVGQCESVRHSAVSDPVTPWIVPLQAPLSMKFSRQECRSGLPFPSPGNLANPGIEPSSPALQADSLPSEPPGLGRAATNPT